MQNHYKINCYILTGSVTALVLIYAGLDIIVKWNTPCYFSSSSDWLPSAEDPSFAPRERSIFFHETSCAGGLSVRQACAVEAAARAHPQRQVYMLFSSPVTYYTMRTSCLAQLQSLHNVRLARVHVADYAKGTVAHSTLLKVLENSSFPVEHSADILRMVTLSKWGGIYLDTDMIVTRSLENLPLNFVAKEAVDGIAIGILSFGKDSIGTNLTDAILKSICQFYDPQRWKANGESVMDSVIASMCAKLPGSDDYYDKPISSCKGLTIFDYELFYSIYFTEYENYFKPPDTKFDLERPYTYHLWNYITNKNGGIKINKGSVFELIAKKYCPTIYNTYGEEFGLI